jgi:hypothetical protein
MQNKILKKLSNLNNKPIISKNNNKTISKFKHHKINLNIKIRPNNQLLKMKKKLRLAKSPCKTKRWIFR